MQTLKDVFIQFGLGAMILNEAQEEFELTGFHETLDGITATVVNAASEETTITEDLPVWTKVQGPEGQATLLSRIQA